MATAQQKARQAEADETAKLIAAKREKAEYYITDPNMRNVGNVRLKPGQKTVVLSADEAKFFLGQGLDTVSPKDRSAQAKEAVEAEKVPEAKTDPVPPAGEAPAGTHAARRAR